jgi:hypothetical protein
MTHFSPDVTADISNVIVEEIAEDSRHPVTDVIPTGEQHEEVFRCTTTAKDGSLRTVP